MKSNSAAREAATKKSSACGDSPYTALVGVKTAEFIAAQAEDFGLPPAIVAGILAKVGCNLIEGNGSMIGVNSMQAVRSMIFGKRRKVNSSAPVVMTPYVRETAEAWSENIGRPFSELIGYFIELGQQHYAREGVLSLCHITPVTALFYTIGHLIREDNEDPAALEVLKPSAKAPPAFLKFEQILAAQGRDKP